MRLGSMLSCGDAFPNLRCRRLADGAQLFTTLIQRSGNPGDYMRSSETLTWKLRHTLKLIR